MSGGRMRERLLFLCRDVLSLLPGFGKHDFKPANAVTRALFRAVFPKKRLNSQEQTIKTDGRELRLLICRRKQLDGRGPTMLWIHGGGMAMGLPEQDARYLKLITELGFTVVCPDYRLSTAAPYPAALDDCMAALMWVASQQEILGGDGRLFVGGSSAGGGLAAALCLLARDRGSPKIDFQLLIYPMLDDRTASIISRKRYACWNSASNRAAWQLYLGQSDSANQTSPYAAPSRCNDLSSLAPACGYVGSADLFFAEDSDYFKRLSESGLPVSFKVFDGCFHAFDIICPHSPQSREAFAFIKRNLSAAAISNNIISS